MDSQPDPQKPPSAQIVGQEFVKQYYTMLNAAPGHLHRFYSNNSSFLHGSTDGRSEEQQQTVTGQVEIHKKIMSLNFNNCHARICQVDSQSSVGGSVVVQVIGELSNDGQPMRRFVQTFVLAPQSAKKYYVHSDIFRYQDVYCPTANELCGDYVEEEVAVDATEQLCYDAADRNEQMIADEVAYEDQVQEQAVDSGCDVSEAPVTPAHNSSVSISDGPIEDTKPLDASPNEAVEEEIPVETADEKALEKEKEDGEKEEETTPEPANVSEPQLVVEPDVVPPPKPMTWAAMASRNAGGPPGGSVMTRSLGTVVHLEPKSETNVAPNVLPPPSTKAAARVAPGVDDQRGARPIVNGAGGGGKDENGPPRRAVGSSGSQQQQQQVYPDDQQVFVGNLPQTFTDQDLIEFFEQFGKVLDFRITRKTGVAGNNVGQKNFGFMAFDSSETVKKVLAARPIFMRKYRLNIEEKKPKEELVAARLSAPRYPGGGTYFVRSGGDGPRRGGGYNRPDDRSNSSDEGRIY
jgi:hypothetical protein